MTLVDDVRERILQTDVALLEDHNVSDQTMMMLAAEHAARVETLCKAIDPARGLAVLAMVARGLIDASEQILAASYPDEGTVHV